MPRTPERGAAADELLRVRVTAAELRAYRLAAKRGKHASVSAFVRAAVNRYISLAEPAEVTRTMMGEE